MTARPLLRAHRLVSLIVAALWVLQALTGLVLVFRVEIDNALTPGATARLDPVALDQAIVGLSKTLPHPVDSLTVADRSGGRFDAFDAEDRRIARLTGRGEVLALEPGLRAAARLDALKSLHESLWLGDAGTALIGLSGILLVSNIVLGLTMAWPGLGGLRRALLPKAGGGGPARTFARHRALGLWFAAPALILALAGVAMALGDPLSDQLGAGRPRPQTPPAREAPVETLPQAIRTAQAIYPGARISVINLPNPDRAWYRMRLRQAGELQHFYGATELFVDARTGKVLANYDGLRAPQPRALFDAFYPIHTAEALGPVGRLLSAAFGAWVLGMAALGLSLWWGRRRLTRRG
ncbi:PepSY-associated TM helix domain-containing protein [Phenylobacterium aquaticum]|uniref:PepSY-associated TM helix domain-containing protein n=1 Tax=Phenylobacterium aquaticum TaxID=1763816 RepID=UPI001F5D68C1|nr:PepSY domain-containing protein [Phenylobacterium aquaticum]